MTRQWWNRDGKNDSVYVHYHSSRIYNFFLRTKPDDLSKKTDKDVS